MTLLDPALDCSPAVNRALDASLAINVAAAGRRDAAHALKMMAREPQSFGWLRRYVLASTKVEQAELALQKIKREIAR